jgi:hypothetical protein
LIVLSKTHALSCAPCWQRQHKTNKKIMRFVFSQTFDVFFKVRPKTSCIPKGRYRRRENPTFTMSLSQTAHASLRQQSQLQT